MQNAPIGPQNFRILVSSLTVHRLFATAMLLAAKFHEDYVPKRANAMFAAAAGLSTTELTELESEFVYILDFSLAVETEEFCAFARSLHHWAVAAAQPRLFLDRLHPTPDDDPIVTTDMDQDPPEQRSTCGGLMDLTAVLQAPFVPLVSNPQHCTS